MENLTIEAPEFDRIKKEAGPATRDATQLLWFVANDESAQRRRGIRRAMDVLQPKVKSDAPTAAQHNYDTDGATTIQFTGSTAFNLTGLRNGETGQIKVIHVLGSATVTIKYDDANSDAIHRFDTGSGADVAVATGKTFIAQYLNSRWRQWSFA
jgi:hypothetical protein